MSSEIDSWGAHDTPRQHLPDWCGRLFRKHELAASQDVHFVSASWDQMLEVWDLKTDVNVATFSCDTAHCCAFADEHMIVADDALERVHILSSEL